MHSVVPACDAAPRDGAAPTSRRRCTSTQIVGSARCAAWGRIQAADSSSSCRQLVGRPSHCVARNWRVSTAIHAEAAVPGEPLVPRPRKRADWTSGPTFGLSKEDAVQMQLEALRNNNEPHRDHGIEVLYRFANFDPFQRSVYFGRPLDLGQFERFRRIFHSPAYSVILCHSDLTVLSVLELSEGLWKQRFLVRGVNGVESQVYEITMFRHLGGRFDGIWFTQSLMCDNIDERSLLV